MENVVIEFLKSWFKQLMRSFYFAKTENTIQYQNEAFFSDTMAGNFLRPHLGQSENFFLTIHMNEQKTLSGQV